MSAFRCEIKSSTIREWAEDNDVDIMIVNAAIKDYLSSEHIEEDLYNHVEVYASDSIEHDTKV